MSDSAYPEEAAGGPAPNLPEYSVSEISMAVKRTVEDNFGYVRIRGEISGLTKARSGHVYMSLKDDKAVLDAVCWRGTASRIKFRPEDGLEVICTGRLTTYPARSRYQLVIEAMEPAGVGALMALLEERRKKLAAEGLFAEERKRELPYLPGVIGVVTSPTGAVIRDILHRLRERFPRHVLLWPVQVQGDGAAEQVAAAIRGFNAMKPGAEIARPDLLIVARGGGSIEDLWAFNEEVVVRAAAESEIPLISAVGHETDTTLIDFASDRRAPTPTAAAEIAVPVRAELRSDIGDLERRLRLGANRLLVERRRTLEGLSRGLRGPRDLIVMAQQRLDEAAGRIDRALIGLRNARAQEFAAVARSLQPRIVTQAIVRHRQDLGRAAERLVRAERLRLREADQRLNGLTKLLNALSFERVLERGYAVVRRREGGLVTAAAAATPGLGLSIRFHDGEVAATVDDGGGAAQKESGKPARPARRKPRRSGIGDSGQGDLF